MINKGHFEIKKNSDINCWDILNCFVFNQIEIQRWSTSLKNGMKFPRMMLVKILDKAVYRYFFFQIYKKSDVIKYRNSTQRQFYAYLILF